MQCSAVGTVSVLDYLGLYIKNQINKITGCTVICFQKLRTRVKCAVETEMGCVLPLSLMKGNICFCARANPVLLAFVMGP